MLCHHATGERLESMVLIKQKTLAAVVIARCEIVSQTFTIIKAVQHNKSD